MIIAHISDFHIFGRERETGLVRLDAAEAARNVVADLVAFSPKVDLVLFTGDVSDGGAPHDYALVRDILSPIDAPVLVVPGNHDRRDTMREAFAGLPFREGDRLDYEFTMGNVRVLALDTLIEGRAPGELTPDTLSWLGERLARPHDGPTYIIMHHPPFPSDIPCFDRIGLFEGRLQFEALVKGYRNGPLHILAGHIHRPFQCFWNGAFCAIGGSPAFQFALRLKAESDPPVVQEPYAYFVHRQNSDGSMAVHTQYVAI